MKVFSVTWYEKLRKLDYIMLFAIIALTCMSLLTLAGAANDYGVRYFNVQLVASCLGLATMIVISTIDYEEIADKLTVPLFIASVFVLAITLVIGTDNGSGNKNWIEIPGFPVSIQPSEFVKVVYIITFSR